MKYYLGNQPEPNEVKEEVEILKEETYPETSEINSEHEKVMKVKRHFLYEDKSKREPNAKHYVGNDGTTTAVYSAKAVHFFDGNELKEIDNSLTDDGDALETKSNSFKTRFKKRSADGEIFEVTKGKCRVGLKSRDLKKHCDCEKDNCTCEKTNAAESRLLFKNVNGNADFEYTVDADRVKENIIVKEKSDKYEYDFDMNIENLEPCISDDGKTLQLKDKDDGEVKFYIPAPFMYDASGESSDLVCYEIAEHTADTLSLKVIADKDWINSDERTFPVTIDPQIASSDTSLFTFEYYEKIEKEGSGGTYWEWKKTKVPDTAVLINKDHRFVLKIKTDDLTIPVESIASVELYLSPTKYCRCDLQVGSNHYWWSGEEIDITKFFKNSSECVLTFTGNGTNDANFLINNSASPLVLIKYCENENEAETKTFSLVGGVTGTLDLATKDFTTEFSDINAGSSTLPLNISHVHLKSDDDFNCGDDWRLNLHQKLENSYNKYVYTDGFGRKHIIEEVYYYIKNSVRNMVRKYDVSIDINGLLTCTVDGQTYEVTRELRTNEGLRLVTRLEDIKNVQYIDQRLDEEKQLEEQVKSYKTTLEDLRTVGAGGAIRVRFNIDSLDEIDEFFSDLPRNMCLTEAEAVQYNSLVLSEEQLTAKIKKIEKSEGTEDYDEFTLQSLQDQLNDVSAQKQVYHHTRTAKAEQAMSLYKEYLSKSEQLKQLKRQLPTAYLIDDNGTILCFNCFGNLCAVTDRYENFITVEWGEIVTSSGKAEVITAVYDGERKTTFKYNRAGRLISITDPDGNRVEYTYSGADFTKVKFSNGKILCFTYLSGNVTCIRCSDQTISIIEYSVYKPRIISNNSNVYAVMEGTKAATESTIDSFVTNNFKKINELKIAYGENYISISDGISKDFTLLDKNNKTCGSYVKKNGKVSGLNLFVRADRKYEFTVSPKKNSEIKGTTVDSEIISYLGIPPEISQLPDMTADYSGYAEADWEVTKLDDFNRPVSGETNWRREYNGKTVYTKTTVSYTYAAGEPDYNRLKKIMTVYTNYNGNQSTTDAEKKVYVEEYSYCEHGNLVKTESYVDGEEGTSGVTVTERICDEKGNIVKEFTYNTLDSSTKFYTENEIASNGRLTAEIDGTGENKTKLIYENDKVVAQVLPNGSKLSYGYDESGNVTAITQSTGSGEENSTNIKYSLGMPTRLTSGNNVVYYEYDHKRRLTKVTANGTETRYSYNDTNDTVTTTFAGVAYKTYKDDEDRVIKTEIGDSSQVEYVYEKGLLRTVEDRITGISTDYTYNSAKALTKVMKGRLTEDYRYNDHGELAIRAYTGEVTQAYGYHYKDNAAREIDYIALPNKLNYYPLKDVNGRNTGKELKNSNGNTIYGEYLSYRKVGDHGTNMPSAIWYAKGKEIRENIKYKYDSCGNISEVTENGVLTARYEYDALNRLVREDNKKFGKSWLYTYDRCGNRIAKREFAFTLRETEKLEELESVDTTYTYDGDRLTGYNGKIVSYGAYGNPVIYKGETLEWQYGKRLKKYGGVTFAYDGYGRRVQKGNITFTYDSSGNLIEHKGLYFVYDGNGISGFKTDNKEYIYRKNAQGDITHILNAVGKVVVEYAYDAWGNCEIIKDTEDNLGEFNPYRYRSYFYDTETKLYYLQTRYYDPETGRFISQDDVSYLDPEHINGLNLYAYCGNNPVMGYDPTGTWDWKKFSGALTIVASFVSLVSGIVLCATGVGTPAGSILIGAGLGGLLSSGGSIVTQGIQNGWSNIDWGQVAIDGGAGFITGALLASPLGYVSTGVLVGVVTFVQNVGSDLYKSNGDWKKVDWATGAFRGVLNGVIAGVGKYFLQNVNYMNKFINNMPAVKAAAEVAKNIGIFGRLSYINLWMQMIIYKDIYIYGIKAIISLFSTIIKSIPLK